ncbi:hypothetical protein [Nocardia gipuzkoensis]|jgi:hypothetical protein
MNRPRPPEPRTRPGLRPADTPRPTGSEEPFDAIMVHDILDYFQKCPRCGHFAQASATVRAYRDGRRETVVSTTCGLPCGWHDTVRPDQLSL